MAENVTIDKDMVLIVTVNGHSLSEITKNFIAVNLKATYIDALLEEHLYDPDDGLNEALAQLDKDWKKFPEHQATIREELMSIKYHCDTHNGSYFRVADI